MSSPSPSGSNSPVLEQELYFLIVKFLEAGPCQRAAEALRDELHENKLLPTRTDWTGQKHFRSYQELVEVNRHIKNDHLLEICKRIGPLLEKDVKASVSGVHTLLGAGRQSVLRTAEDVATSKWTGPTFVACRHGHALYPPHNLAQPVNINNSLRARDLCGNQSHDVILSQRLYNKISLLSRSLGHLSAVYCVAFDRTGKLFITGADDHLVKIWSAVSGRLLVTLRGCGAEITDLAVNYENTVIAAGSCDKQIRLWCLKTAIPLAVLHGHSGMITSLQFCPFVRGITRYLMSTGGDGCVCFWSWNVLTRKFAAKPIKFIERSRAGAQMLCSSFSPGGVFLATGNSDHVLRVYCFTSTQPEKICELESHNDRVDSIQYASRCDRFVSGSKDGTAKIWRYERKEWRAITLSMSTQLPGATSPNEEAKGTKYRVTMVGWSQDDQYVITAVSDVSLKVWDSYSGQLLHVLKGHEDEVFVLEHSPVDHRIMVSAGHDGYIIIWDIKSGTMIKRFFNTIEGQGHGAVFDCKWSPDGQMFAATDSHGFSLLFGFGSNERFKKLPEEMFFHTDYRPLIRDANNFVLDEQTQQPPHLMPPPFLVDIDGNPQPPSLQKLVPGREHLTDQNQLIPQLGVTPSGDREVLDQAVAEFMVPDIDVPPPPPPEEEEVEVEEEEEEEEEEPEPSGAEPQPGSVAADHRPSLDQMIAVMQRQQDQRDHRGTASASGSGREGPTSPPPSRGPRRSGEVEGVRQATGHVPVSQQATGQDLALCKRRVIARELGNALYRTALELHQAMADIEIKKYVCERKKKVSTPSKRAAHSSDDEGPSVRTRKTKKRSSRAQGSSRSTRNEETGRNRLTTLALYDTDYEEEEEEEESAPVESEATPQSSQRRDRDRDEDTEEDEMWSSSSADGESSEYSDWTQDTGINLQPPKRSQRQPKRRKMTTTEDETDDGQHREPSRRATTSSQRKRSPERKKQMSRERKQRQQRKIMQHATEHTGELPEEFKPPDWLTNTIPRKVPYVPQMGDEVIYFRQGHELYLHAVKRRKVFDVNPKKNQPWHKMPHLREQELVKVVGIKYEIRPPRLVCLKLAFIDPETCRMTGGSFTIKYHDMPDVIDFLVLKQPFDISRERNWKAGDRFRSMIDDAWWTGVIETREPLSVEFADSLFQCFNVRWDNGEKEKMSPWDLEPNGEDDEPDEIGGSRPVSAEELRCLMYIPKEGEWLGDCRDAECDRIFRGLGSIMELSLAEPFLAPVDLNAFPAYAMVIEYMVDLTMIKSRLENRFYRRVNSVQYDVRYIESNAARFNEVGSLIVKQARLITELIMRLIGDPECVDPMPIYTELMRDSNFAVLPRKRSENSRVVVDSDSDDAEDGGEGTSSRLARSKKGGKKKRSQRSVEPNAWKAQCRQLLDIIFDCDDSVPFRHPVNPDDYPEYYRIVDNPVDLDSIREQLSCDTYDSPTVFCKDIRLVFHNSKLFNTNKRSRIYGMTLRLAAMVEEQLNDIVTDWKSAKKFQKTGGLPPSLRSQSSGGTASAAASVVGASTAHVRPTGSQNSRRSSGASAPSRRASGVLSDERRSLLAAAAASQPRTMSGQFLSPSERLSASLNRSHARPSSSRGPAQTTRYGRSVKRKRQLTESSENTEHGLESEGSEFDFDDALAKQQKRKVQKSKKSSRRSQRKPAKTEEENGHNRYGTRNKTGAIKRRRYETENDETEVEEEEEKRKSRGGGSDSDTEENTAQKSEDGGDDSDKGSKSSSSSSSSSSDSATEIEDANKDSDNDDDVIRNRRKRRNDDRSRRNDDRSRRNDDRSRRNDDRSRRNDDRRDDDEEDNDDDDDDDIRNRRNDGSRNDDDDDDDDRRHRTNRGNDDRRSRTNDDEEEDGDDGDDGDVRRSSRMATKHSTRASRSSNLQRRSGASSGNSSFSRTPPEQDSRGGTRNTRNQGKRTVTYREDSDNERNGNGDQDSEDSEGGPVSVSSRGRVRRLTPRARAVLLGDS